MSAEQKRSYAVLVDPIPDGREPELIGPLDEDAASAYESLRSREEWNEVRRVPLRGVAREECFRAQLKPDEIARGIVLSAEAYRVLCGLVQPSRDVEADQIYAEDETWEELRMLFPLHRYRAVPGGPVVTDGVEGEGMEEQ